ncbi:MAG: hypothetical protein OXC48_10540, partial [Endozoicomonadaceae bacterium]|nr:hypothetical protein [Endozoicomonadaceae bacterium]
MANTGLPDELSYDITYPFFSILKADTLVRKPLHSPMAFNNLNHLISENKGVEYINQKKMIQLIKVPLFFWLIKEYSCFHDERKPASSPAITIRGMLYDLECRTKNDPVAELVLEFLNLPLKITPSKSSSYHSVLSKFKQFTSQLLFAKQAEKSFSERLALLTSSPYTEEKNKQQRLLNLISSGYGYYKKYTFTSFESDKSGKTVPVTSDYIMIPEEQSQQLLGVNYPAVNGADDTSATTNIMGVKFSDSSFTKAAALATLGLCLFPSAYAAMTPIISSSQCGINGVCSLHNSYSLSDKNFSMVLQHDSSGCYKLAENIHLNAQHELPVFQDCTNPFSGTLDTGSYTINAGNGISPVFGCINKATITGRFDFCTSDNAYIPPVIAKQALNRNIINIQQVDSCKIQHPVFGNITGDNNQITFSGESKEIRVAQGSGVIATRVSGNNNTITLTHGQSYDSPMISTAGGHNNTYYQQNMNITRLTDRYLLNHKLLIADHFTGNETNIIQNNIKATYTTMDTQNPNHETSDAQTGTVYGFHTNIDILPMPEIIRLTNISENTEQRTIIENHGRFEVFKNGRWNSVCENTLSQKTAHTACKILGYTGAENEGSRLLLKNRLSVAKLESLPIHLNKQCTGYEKHLQDCNTTASDTSACQNNRESLLSCFSGISPGVRTDIEATGDIGIRLTDPNSASPDRLDITRNRNGRVEFYDRSNTSFSLCSNGFRDTEANVICLTLGFGWGEQTFPQRVPLDESIPVRQNIWACKGTEFHLNLCSLKNVSYSDCTHDNDVFIRCRTNPPSIGFYFRLTDRHSTGELRADVSNTGIGRLEMFSAVANTPGFVPFRIGKIQNEAVINVCNTLGFNNGTVSYLTAEPLPTLCGFGSTEYALNCEAVTPFSFCLELIDHSGNPSLCELSIGNAVLFCTKNNTKEIPQLQRSPQRCSLSNQNSNTFFSESSDIRDKYQANECPNKLWNIDGVHLPERIRSQCDCIHQLDTTIIKDWLTAWQIRCKNSSNHCNCHLPYEKMLGIATEDSRYKEVFLVSRQNYLNSTQNTQGLVLVRKLFSDEGIQVLNPVSENLVTGTILVNHIIIDQHLLGLYPAANDRDIQLFWSPLEQNNGT